jgi:hypothetical protein
MLPASHAAQPLVLLPLTLTRAVEVAAPRTAAVWARPSGAPPLARMTIRPRRTSIRPLWRTGQPCPHAWRSSRSSLDSKVLTSWRRRRRKRASTSRPRRAPQAEAAASALSFVRQHRPAVEVVPPRAAAMGASVRSIVVGPYVDSTPPDLDSTSMVDRSAAPHAWRTPASIRRYLHAGARLCSSLALAPQARVAITADARSSHDEAGVVVPQLAWKLEVRDDDLDAAMPEFAPDGKWERLGRG